MLIDRYINSAAPLAKKRIQFPGSRRATHPSHSPPSSDGKVHRVFQYGFLKLHAESCSCRPHITCKRLVCIVSGRNCREPGCIAEPTAGFKLSRLRAFQLGLDFWGQSADLLRSFPPTTRLFSITSFPARPVMVSAHV
jgi:hypothetical protein